ncbi:MAG: histidine kinase N-terminal 7TM domain-containing protein [Vicinamibacteria bacterium]
MGWQFRIAAAPLLAGAACLALVAALAWRRRPSHGSLALVGLAFCMVVYDVGYALEIGSSSLEGVRLYLAIQYLGVANLPAMVLFAVLGYTGAQRLVNPASVLLVSVLPALTCALAFTNERHELIWRNLRIDPSGDLTRTFFERGQWYWIHNGYAYLLLSGGIAVLAGELARARGLFKRQLWVLLTGLLVPVGAHAAYLLTPGFEGVDPNPYAQSIAALVIAWGMLGMGLWDVLPVARETIVASLRDAVFVLDQHGRLADLNPAALELLPSDAERVQGRLASELLPDLATPIERARRGETLRTELTRTLADRPRHFDASLTPLPLARDVYGVLAVLHDATRRVEGQRLRESLTRTMVHDLRNPLTAIHGSLELLEGESAQLSPHARELVDLGRQSSQRMLDVVNAILEVERLRGERIVLDLEWTDPGEMLGRAARLQTALAAGKQQRLEVEVESGLPPLELDRRLIDRVLQNLIGNALKFTQRGGRVRLRARAAPGGGALELGVTDDGPGIAAPLRERLFAEFVTGDVSGRGSGLGLAFCRLAVLAHGGTIRVESEPGRGASFFFTLPVSAPASAAGTKPAAREKVAAGASRR